jgi:hypothetical protein
MELSRRHFIGVAGVAAVAGLATSAAAQSRDVAGGLFPIPVSASDDPLTYLTSEHFTPFIGTSFRGRGSSGTAAFTLIAVDDNAAKGRTETVTNGYTLIFSARGRAADDIYTFDHASLGKLRLFISGFGLAGSKYQAIINRLKQ